MIHASFCHAPQPQTYLLDFLLGKPTFDANKQKASPTTFQCMNLFQLREILYRLWFCIQVISLYT